MEKHLPKKNVDAEALSKIKLVAFIFITAGFLAMFLSLMTISQIQEAYRVNYITAPQPDLRPLYVAVFFISILFLIEWVLLLKGNLTQNIFYLGMILSAVMLAIIPLGLIFGLVNIYLLPKNKALFGLK